MRGGKEIARVEGKAGKGKKEGRGGVERRRRGQM